MLQNKPDTYLVGEVWDSTSVIAPYLDHALDSAFNFDLTDKLIGAAEGERNPDIAFTLQRMYTAYEKTSGGQFIDAPFLNNHDKNRVMTRLGGNIDHVTRTMTTAIALETSKGNIALALALGMILLAIALVVNAALMGIRRLANHFAYA